VQNAERRLRRIVWVGILILGGCLVLRLFLPLREFSGPSVSHENGISVLRDATGNLILDPWKRPYLYVGPTLGHPRPRVVSLGADGKPGGEGESADIDSDQLLEEKR
jgi:type II secretory pathway pseudopilin PulG